MATPLADRIRPQSIEEMVGQEHLIGENKPLRNIIDSGTVPNMIFYGPSGTGKTTLARMIAKKTDRTLRKLNCTTASTQDIRDIFDELNISKCNGYVENLNKYNVINTAIPNNRLCIVIYSQKSIVISNSYPIILNKLAINM